MGLGAGVESTQSYREGQLGDSLHFVQNTFDMQKSDLSSSHPPGEGSVESWLVPCESQFIKIGHLPQRVSPRTAV